MSVVVLQDLPEIFHEDFSIRPCDENHVISLTKALKEGDSLPMPRVALVEGKLVALSGNHTLLALSRAGKPLEVIHLGELDYLSALKVVLESNPVGYRPPSQREFQAFLSRAYLRARQIGVERKDFINFMVRTTGRSQATIYRLLADVFRSEDENIKHTAFQLLASGKPIKVVANALGVSITTVRRWLRTNKGGNQTLPRLKIFDDSNRIHVDFLKVIQLYIDTFPRPSLDGLFVWLCRRYAVDYGEWGSFTRGIRDFLPEELLSSLGVGGKVFLLTKERWKEAKKELNKKAKAKAFQQPEKEGKRERGITLKGVRSELSKLSRRIEEILEKTDGDVKSELARVLSQVYSLRERVDKSLTTKTPEEVASIVRHGLDLLDRVHRLKTGYSILNQDNYGKYFNLLKPAVSFLLKRHKNDEEKVKRALLVAMVYNAYINDAEWAEFLRSTVEKIDWLKHKFSIGHSVWSKILKKNFQKQDFNLLVDEVLKVFEAQKSISKSSPSSSSISGAAAAPAG